MKLLFVFALLALICMARTAPTPSTTSRNLVFEEYQDDNAEVIDNVNDDDDDDDDEPVEIKTTTTEDENEDDETAEIKTTTTEDENEDDETETDTVVNENDDDDDEEEEEETTTTTTKTSTRSTFVFPSRNRNIIPSRQPFINRRTSTTTTTTTTAAFDDEDADESEQDFEGDFKYIKNFRQYMQKLMEDIKKFIRNITGADFSQPATYDELNQYHDE